MMILSLTFVELAVSVSVAVTPNQTGKELNAFNYSVKLFGCGRKVFSNGLKRFLRQKFHLNIANELKNIFAELKEPMSSVAKLDEWKTEIEFIILTSKSVKLFPFVLLKPNLVKQIHLKYLGLYSL